MARITVEDCLKEEKNRFALVMLAATRTRQILQGAPVALDSIKNKAVVSSLREIAAGKVEFKTEEELQLEAEEARRLREERLQKAGVLFGNESSNGSDSSSDSDSGSGTEDSEKEPLESSENVLIAEKEASATDDDASSEDSAADSSEEV